MKKRAIEWWAVFLWVWLFVLILVTLAVVGAYTHAQTTIAGGTVSSGVVGDTALVTVDYSETGTTFVNKFAGFLSSSINNSPVYPSTALYETGMQPYAHRSHYQNARVYTAVTGNGGTYTRTVCGSGAWMCGSPSQNPYDEPAGRAAWETYCAGKVTADAASYSSTIYDIWNEPDILLFGDIDGSNDTMDTANEQSKFSDTVIWCAAAARTVDASAVLMAPSTYNGPAQMMGWLLDTGSAGATTWSAAYGGTMAYTTHSGLAELDAADVDIELSMHIFLLEDYMHLWSDWLGAVRQSLHDEIQDSNLTNMEGYWGSTAALTGLQIRVNEIGSLRRWDSENYESAFAQHGHMIAAFAALHGAANVDVDSGNITCWEDPEPGQCSESAFKFCYSDSDCTGTCSLPNVCKRSCPGGTPDCQGHATCVGGTCTTTTSCSYGSDCPSTYWCKHAGPSTCGQTSMNSVLRPAVGAVPNPSEKRPLWHALSWYAELAGDEAIPVSSHPRIYALAAGDDTAKEYRVLIGSTPMTAGGTLANHSYPRLTIEMQSMPTSCSGTLYQQVIRTPLYLAEFTDPDDLWLNSSGGASTDGNGDLSVTLTSIRPNDVVYLYFDGSGC